MRYQWKSQPGAIVRGVIVAIIVGLLLAAPAVIPPKWFVERRAVAVRLAGPVRVLPEQHRGVVAAGARHLLAEIFDETFANVELAGAARDELFKFLVGGAVRQARAEQPAIEHTKEPRQATEELAGLFDDEAAVAERGLEGRCSFRARNRARGTQAFESLAGLLAGKFENGIGTSTENIDSNAKRYEISPSKLRGSEESSGNGATMGESAQARSSAVVAGGTLQKADDGVKGKRVSWPQERVREKRRTLRFLLYRSYVN